MTKIHKTTLNGILTLFEPENALPLIFDSPHSGTAYPADFDYACDVKTLEKAEDKYVDELFINAPNHGATLLCAEFPRTYIDVNRAENDIDVDLLEDIWDEEIEATSRSHAGIGLIRRLIKPGVPLYNRHLKSSEVKHRIETYYRPYHATLKEIIEKAHYRFGQVWHINCHSMPSQEAQSFRINPLKAADIVLGDRDGTTCDIHFVHAVRGFLRGLGYKVAINDPYKGVELVRRYSNAATGRHSLQIEIARALYLNEDTYEKHSGFIEVQRNMERLTRFCADYVEHRNAYPVAAD